MLSRLIHFLQETTASLEAFGRLGNDLISLGVTGITVADSVLVERHACELYQRAELEDAFFDRLFSATAQIWPKDATDLFVRASCRYHDTWSEDKLRIERDASALRNAVESIFRSIGTPRSRASRIAHDRPDGDDAVAIVIRAFFPVRWTVLSRNPKSGEPVNINEWSEVATNRLPNRPAAYLDVARRCEQSLGRPIQISFDSALPPQVVSVAAPIMTDRARLEALIDLFGRGCIGELDLIRQVDHWMLGSVSFVLDPSPENPSLRGISAAPGCAYGLVALIRFQHGRFTEPRAVLFLHEATPDDLLDIKFSAAVVCAIGGKSSHGAVMCRRMCRPCVVGTGVKVDTKKRRLLLSSGMAIPEGSPVAIDATRESSIFPYSLRSNRPIPNARIVKKRLMSWPEFWNANPRPAT
jgi:phosphohistidine swiveling domain-containing protein